MSTALTVYFTKVAATSVATAEQLATTTGGTLGNNSTTIGTASGANCFGEAYGQGNVPAWPALSAIGSPSGQGWLLDATTLEGQQFIAGSWAPTIRLQIGVDTGQITADIHCRAYRRGAGGLYTLIGEMIRASTNVTTTVASFSSSFTGTSLPLTNFNLGDKLYVDIWLNITANTNTLSTATIKVFGATSSSQGVATAQVVTAGYQVQPTPAAIFLAGLGGRHRSIGRIQ